MGLTGKEDWAFVGLPLLVKKVSLFNRCKALHEKKKKETRGKEEKTRLIAHSTLLD